MTVSARFRVKGVPAVLDDLMEFHILNIFVVEKQERLNYLQQYQVYYRFLVYYLSCFSSESPEVHLPENLKSQAADPGNSVVFDCLLFRMSQQGLT